MQKKITAIWQQVKISTFTINKQCYRIFYLLFYCIFAASTINLHAALRVTTINNIVGSAPYLVLSDNSKLSDFNELIGFKMPDRQGGLIKINADNSNDIIIIPSDIKFRDILTLVNANGDAHNIPATAQHDDDGDSGTPTGSMTATWYIGDSTLEDLDQTFPICGGPYRLIIEADSVKTNTLYGSPNSFNYGSGSATYQFEPELKNQCEATAVMTLTLNDTEQSKIADGISLFHYTVKLSDENGNPFVGSTITSRVLFPVDAQVVLSPLTTTTDTQGQATFTLTSTTTKVENISIESSFTKTDNATLKIDSNNASQLVSFLEGDIDTSKSSLTCNKYRFYTGEGTATCTLIVKDKNNNPIDITDNDLNFSYYFKADSGSSGTSGNKSNTDTATVGSFTNLTETETQGVYTLDYTPGQYVGFNTVNFIVKNTSLGSKTIKIRPNINTAKVSAQITPTESVIANSNDYYTLNVTYQDAYNNKYLLSSQGDSQDDSDINNLVASISAASEEYDVNISLITNDIPNSSLAQFNVSATSIGDKKVNINLGLANDKSKYVTTTQTLSFIADANSPVVRWGNKSNLGSINQNFDLKPLLQDSYGNKLSGSINFNLSSNNASLSPSNTIIFDSQSNSYSLLLTDSVTESVTITPYSNALAKSIDTSKTIRFLSSLSELNIISVDTSDKNTIADGTTTRAVEVNVVDINGTPVNAASVKLSVTNGAKSYISSNNTGDKSHSIQSLTVKTNADGVAKFYVNSYTNGKTALGIDVLNDTNSVVDSQQLDLEYTLWYKAAEGNVKTNLSSLTWPSTAGTPAFISDKMVKTNNISIYAPTDSSNNDRSNYRYKFVTSNLQETTSSFLSIDSTTGKISVTAAPTSKSQITTIYVLAEYTGNDKKPSRLWRWNLSNYWRYQGMILAMGSCPTGYAYPTKSQAKQLFDNFGRTGLYAVTGETNTNRGPKYIYGLTSSDGFGYYRIDSEWSITSMYNSANGAGFKSKSAMVWCFLNK